MSCKTLNSQNATNTNHLKDLKNQFRLTFLIRMSKKAIASQIIQKNNLNTSRNAAANIGTAQRQQHKRNILKLHLKLAKITKVTKILSKLTLTK